MPIAKIAALFDKPSVALLASATTAGTAGAVEWLQKATGSGSPVGGLTIAFSCVAAGAVAIRWIRNILVMLVRDFRAIREGKIPDKDA